MSKSYLVNFENDVLSARSESSYKQDRLFIVLACKDPDKEIHAVNHGYSITDPNDPRAVTQTLPTAASPHWKFTGTLTFDRMEDARKAAQFVNAYSRTPRLVADVKNEMRVYNDKHFPDLSHGHLTSNYTNFIRYIPRAGKFNILTPAVFWAFSNGIEVELGMKA